VPKTEISCPKDDENPETTASACVIRKQGGHQTQGAGSEPEDVADMGNASAF
jgi:hypothetical protein